MKSERGITLTALIIYIALSLVAVTAIASFTSFFVSNMAQIRDKQNYAPEFNKFSMFFVEDVKNNKTADVTKTKLTFEDGNVYKFNASENAVYRNDTKIVENIDNFSFSSTTEKVANTTKQIINVKMSSDGKVNFTNGIDYTLKYW